MASPAPASSAPSTANVAPRYGDINRLTVDVSSTAVADTQT